MRIHKPLSIVDLLDAGDNGHAWGVNDAMARIAAEGKGVIVLLNCTESTTQLLENVAETPRAKPPARITDLFNHGIGAQILRDLKVGRMRLLAAPLKMHSMAGWALEVVGYEKSPGAKAAGKSAAKKT